MLHSARIEKIAVDLQHAVIGNAKLDAKKAADEQAQQDDASRNISRRAAEAMGTPDVSMQKLIEIYANLYDEQTNPEGVISLGVAENSLMHEEIAAYLNKNLKIKEYDFTYGNGPGGSHRLKAALAKLFNNHFSPVIPVEACQIVTASGVGAALDLLAWSTCDEHDGILVGRPLYTGFYHDLRGRANVDLVPVDFGDVDPMSVDALEAYERQLVRSKADGVTVKAVMLCNPHNPLGKCYSVDAIKAYAIFCQEHQLHLICDEVYAFSIYKTTANKDALPYTSVLSIDLDGLIDKRLVHVLYGMSKDFCSNGLRCGVVLSQSNDEVLNAVRTASVFPWPSSLTDAAWATILEDEAFLKEFIGANQRKLAENYDFVTQFLEKHGIDYVRGSSAGFFVWVDLSPYLKTESGDEGVASADELTKSRVTNSTPALRRADDEFLEKLVGAGVYLATSNAFFSEKHGWYRITFSVAKSVLDTGLQRVEKVLQGRDTKGRVPEREVHNPEMERMGEVAA